MPLGDNPGDRYNALMAFGDIGSKISEALLQMAQVKDQREQRALATAQNAAQMALSLEQIERDHRNNLATYIEGGWSGMPGENVGAPAVSPATRSLIDAAYPMHDFSMTGEGLMDSSMKGYGQPSVYDREKDRTLPQPTYSVSPTGVTGTGFTDIEGATEAYGELPEVEKQPTFNVTYNAEGYPVVTGSGMSQEQATQFATDIMETDLYLVGGKERAASNIAYLDTMPDIDEATKAYLRTADPEYIETFVQTDITNRNRPQTATEVHQRALVQYQTANEGVRMMLQLIEEHGGVQAGLEQLTSTGRQRLMAGMWLSPAQERFLAASDLLIGSILRVTSGAAIGEKETANKRQQLMPLPGEDVSVSMAKLGAMFEQVRTINYMAGIAGGNIPTNMSMDAPNPFWGNTAQELDIDQIIQSNIQMGATEDQIIDVLLNYGLSDDQIEQKLATIPGMN
jgi:hypothetical protein